MRSKICAALAVAVVVSGCANVGNMAGDAGQQVGAALGSIFGTPIEVSDSVSKVATIKDTKWVTAPSSVGQELGWKFTYNLPKGCKAGWITLHVYAGNTIIDTITKAVVDVPANTDVFVSDKTYPKGRPTRVTLDSFKC
jgi:hypothetical protein